VHLAIIRAMGAWRRASRGSRVRAVLGAAGAIACALLGAGCHTGHPPPLSASALEDARHFPFFRVYWAGYSFEGVAITAADGREAYDRSAGTSVYYGDCESAHGALHTGGCTLPLQVQTAVYDLHSSRDLGSQTSIVIRGVPATVFDGGRAIRLYTGILAITVYSDTPGRALRGVQALRPLNAGGRPYVALPAPRYAPALWGPGAQRAIDVALARGSLLPPLESGPEPAPQLIPHDGQLIAGSGNS
jgi:hypothetical protein